jgi:hypothetical protein
MSINIYRSAAVSLQPEDVLFIRNQVFDNPNPEQHKVADQIASFKAGTLSDSAIKDPDRPESTPRNDETSEPDSVAADASNEVKPSTTQAMGADADTGIRSRAWPDVGTELTATYYGVEYSAKIIPAIKKLKSGKQIQISTGAATGRICDSMSEAMLIATANQRAEQNLRRKGVANGWDFWQWDA